MIPERIGDGSERAEAPLVLLERARLAQREWAARTVSDRLRIARAARHLIADRAVALADAVGRHDRAATLSAEVLPLADALRFLERDAERLLAPRRLGRRGRPAWLSGVGLELSREPLGVVLIIGPGNYPLLLAAVQAMQALIAGNAVVIKPAPGAADAMRAFGRVLADAGLPHGLFALLSESIDAARAAIRHGVDHVVLTGSVETGRSVLRQLAPRLTPATMELSGCDAVFVRADADPSLVVRALAFGLTLNDGATCIAPRRVLLPDALLGSVSDGLARRLSRRPEVRLSSTIALEATDAIERAIRDGARVVCGGPPGDGRMSPTVLAGVTPTMAIARLDLFAPLASLITVDDDEQALEMAAICPYALGASVFGADRTRAEALARRVRAGVVVVNDMIVPTADPRVPFGGRGESGFGVTRGAEGLLAMTATRALIVQRGRRRPHLSPQPENAAELFEAWIATAHGRSMRRRLGALARLVRAGRRARTSTQRRDGT